MKGRKEARANKKSVLLLVVLLFLPLGATTYYVAKTGYDGDDGSSAHPWLTVNHAVATCVAGDTCWVKRGTYNEGEVMLNTAGAYSAPIVFKSYDGWNTIIVGAVQFNKRHCRVEGFEIILDITIDNQAVKFTGDPDSSSVSGCLMVPSAARDTICGILVNSEGDDSHRVQHVVVDGNTVHGFGGGEHGHGIYACGNHTVITRNIVFDNEENGLQIYPSADSDTVAYNVSYKNRHGNGISLLGFDNWVHDNVCHDNYLAAGMHGLYGSYNNEISNNVFYGNGYGMYFDDNVDSVLVRNNICLNNEVALALGNGAVTTLDYNCYYPNDSRAFDWGSGSGNFAAYKTATGQDSNSICQNPLFVDTSLHNYHLQGTSPCIDAGDTTTPPGYDFDHFPTPWGRAVDIGAYEYHPFVAYRDVMTDIVSPRHNEVPGLVSVEIKLTNLGNVPAWVPRLDVTIKPTGYADHKENIAIPVGESLMMTLNPWVCPIGDQTCTAWITYPSDMYPPHDTMVSSITVGIPGWTELTSLPAPPSGKTIKDGGCMTYDALTDQIYASKGNKTGDFYSYNVGTGAWTTLTAIPLGAEEKEVYKGSMACSNGNGTLYLTKGNNTIGYWSYNTTTKAWTQLTNVPTGSSGKKVKQGAGLVWATKHGTGAVYLLKGYRNEFYKYDPLTNSWTNLLDAPIGIANHLKWDAGSWIVADADAGNMIYAFKAKYHEMYKYDTDADTWSHAIHAMPIPGSAGDKKAKDGSCAAWYNGKIYAFKGGNTSEFWRYFPLADSWHKQDDIPIVGTSGLRKKVKAGAALAGYPGTGIYGFKGNKSLEFWRYTPYDVVGAQPSRDGVTGASTGIASVAFAIAPNPLSSGYATVRYSLPKAGLATLNVFDVTGRTVLTQTLAAGRTGTASLDLRKLEAGVYLVKVATEGFSTTQKLVVEH